MSAFPLDIDETLPFRFAVGVDALGRLVFEEAFSWSTYGDWLVFTDQPAGEDPAPTQRWIRLSAVVAYEQRIRIEP